MAAAMTKHRFLLISLLALVSVRAAPLPPVQKVVTVTYTATATPTREYEQTSSFSTTLAPYAPSTSSATPLGLQLPHYSDGDHSRYAKWVPPKSQDNRFTTATYVPQKPPSNQAPVSPGHIDPGSVNGICYSPFGNSQGSCKSKSQIKAELQTLISAGFNVIRLYGTECGQVPLAVAAIQGTGTKLFLGVYSPQQYMRELRQLIQQVGGNWNLVHTVSILNEAVNDNVVTAEEAVSITKQCKAELVANGYHGPVVCVDTFVAYYNNPILYQAGDYVAANCHPYFDGNVVASGSGQFLADQAAKLRHDSGGRDVLITETGWPKAGDVNLAAVPSLSNQEAAVRAIKATMGNHVILFTAFDEQWKSPGKLDVERHWGILDGAQT